MNYLLKTAGILLLLSYGIGGVSAQQLGFEYDAAGNQTTRSWICINCASQQQALVQPATETTFSSQTLKAYPNPVTEMLQVDWTGNGETYLKTVEVFSLNGTRVFRKEYRQQDSHTAISFTRLSAGMYLVQATYSDGRKETIKVMKI